MEVLLAVVRLLLINPVVTPLLLLGLPFQQVSQQNGGNADTVDSLHAASVS